MIATTVALAANLAAGLALVVQDQTPLRAAPAGNTATQALLWPGDLLEVRGERLDQLQVYDHARERAGYVKASQLRLLSTEEADAPALLAVLRFLRDTPGAESLGIAYAAAYLRAAPAQALTAEPFDALGTMAERLARRASARGANMGRNAETVAAHLESAGRYGVKFTSFEREGGLQLCYEGEAFRRVLAMQATPEQQARAVLALTRHDCVDPALLPTQRVALDRGRAELLDRIDANAFAQLGEPSRNRLRVRRAGLWATLAHQRSRDGGDAAAAAQRAVDALAGVVKAELGDDEQAEYGEAGVRVGASRWALEPPVATGSRLQLAVEPGEPGQRCVRVSESLKGSTLVRRCTYATVWPASWRVAPDGRSAVLAVQPLEGWTELWVLRAGAEGWTVDVLPPAATEPGLGYAEFAGWVAGAPKLLVAREAKVEGRLRRSFEVLALDTLATEKQAREPQWLALFAKWQDPLWRRHTVSLR